MRPAPRLVFPRVLFAIFLLLLILREILPNFINPNHETPLTLTTQTHHFTYKVSTYTNTHSKRCALIRCGSEYANRLYHHSTCDVLFVEIVQSNRNMSFHFCPVDYIHTQWNALSRKYNHGMYFISDDVQLRMLPTDLPLDGKSVQFSAAQNGRDFSIAWFSMMPTHVVRPLFDAWYNAIGNPNVTKTTTTTPEIAALNHVRSCRSPDVVCHSRAAAIAWQCNSVRNEMACLAKPFPMLALRLAGIALAITVVFSTIIVATGHVLPRMRGALGTPLNAHLVSLKFTHILIAALIIAFTGEDWVFIVKTLSRLVGVAYKHDLHHEPFNVPAEVYRAVPDLRGLYSGYAYVFRDNTQMVRITGPGVSLVVGGTSVVLFIKRVLYDGLLVKSIAAVLVVRLACETIGNVSGLGKLEASVEDDEYIRFRSDLPVEVKGSSTTKRERQNRSFLVGRDRGPRK